MSRTSSAHSMVVGVMSGVVCLVIALLSLAWTIAEEQAQDSGEYSEEIRWLKKLSGMTVYCAKDPFSVLVKSPKAPGNGFLFSAHDQKIIVRCEPDDEADSNNAWREAQLMVGENYSVTFDCRPSVQGDVRELTLALRDYGLIDFNVDGQWDFRSWYPPDTRVEVPFQNEWREVTVEDGSRFRRKLCGGGYVRFDQETGTWKSDE